MTEHNDAYDPLDDTPEGDWKPPAKPRDNAGDPRLSALYKALRYRFLAQCRMHRNADGTYGKPCGICRQPIDYRLNHRSPDAPQVDHIAPVRLFPERALDESNFQPAHAHCNRSKERRYADEKCQIGEPSEAW